MSTLPEVVRDGVRYRLPLTPEVAPAIVAALLADTAEQRAAWLRRALIADSPFAVWCALEAPEAVDSEPLGALCEWIGPRLATALAAARAEASPPPARKMPAKYPVNAARRGREARRTGPLADGDALLVTLAQAVDWLVACGTPRPRRAAAAAALPRWLATALADFTARQPRSGASGQPSSDPPPLVEIIPRIAARVAADGQRPADFERLLEQAKLEALKEFAYGAGHEINNPLANISARAQTLLKDERDPERRQKLAAINTQAFRAHEMIADLMLFARPPAIEPESLDAADLLTRLVATCQAQADEQQTRLELRLPDERLTVWADSSALSVAIRALIVNALEALGRGGRVQVCVERAPETNHRSIADSPEERSDRKTTSTSPEPSPVLSLRERGLEAEVVFRPLQSGVAISVRDDGPGIPPEIRPRIFDPYFSGREAGRGLGFGLCKCWRVVDALAGRIEVASDAGQGAEFTIILPPGPSSDQNPAENSRRVTPPG